MGMKEIFNKIRAKFQKVKMSIAEFVEDNKGQIKDAMFLADQIYDANEGSLKMKSVIAMFILAINTKCGCSLNADQIGTQATKFIEDEYQKVYESL